MLSQVTLEYSTWRSSLGARGSAFLGDAGLWAAAEESTPFWGPGISLPLR